MNNLKNESFEGDDISVPDVKKYLPETKGKRSGTALCLSGGGYRSALFHLGSLRRLNELGVLSSLDTISSVSGGSILAAHLMECMRPWPEKGQVFSEWEKRVSIPFRLFTSKDIRTRPLLKRWLLPWNWIRPSTQAKSLEKRYKKRLTSSRLSELPERPRFIFCATDIVFGVNWIFEKKRVGDWQAGYVKPAPDWPVAFAVASSSCFPPVFDPMKIPKKGRGLSGGRFKTDASNNELVSKLRLSDGGVYDNMGIEPVWKDHQVVMVSDGGAPFEFTVNKTPLGRIKRCLSVARKQAEAIRKRWLIANFEGDVLNGTYWGIGSASKSYASDPFSGFSKKLAKDIISKIRTDLDGFTVAETAVLENHGYLITEAAIKKHLPHLVVIKDAPLEIPHPDWMDEIKISAALSESHKRFSWNRIFGKCP